MKKIYTAILSIFIYVGYAQVNLDFETGTAAGWTITEGTNTNSSTMAGCCPSPTTRFTITTAGTDPSAPALPTVAPGGGLRSLKLGDGSTAGGFVVRATQSFPVTVANALFIFKYAVVFGDSPHGCTDQPYFNMIFSDCAGNPIPCGTYNVQQPGSSCSAGDPSFVSTGGGFNYAPWRTKALDMTPLIGTCVKITVTAGDCTAGGHSGWGYFDSYTQPLALSLNGIEIPVGTTTSNNCATGPNVLCAPAGFSGYTWNGPGVTGSVTQCVNANAAGAYSVALNTAGACTTPILFCNFTPVPMPNADFNFTTTPCSSTFTVPFVDNTNLMGGPAITSYTWAYGDGASTIGVTSNPIHTYTSTGVKNVTLTVTNGGCVDNIVKPVTLSAGPTANFSVTSVCQSTATAFTDLSTTPSGTVNAWSWDFTNNASADNLTQNPTFTYPLSGTFTAALTVTNSELCSDTKTLVVNVWGHSIPNFSSSNACNGSANSFTNTTDITTNANVGVTPTYSWDFGDATATSALVNPSHTYVLPANVNTVYNATLTSTTSHGCVDVVTKPVNIYATPTASFTSNEVCLGSATNLVDASNGNGNPLSGYAWDFSSNGTVDVTGVPNPNYIFPVSGSNAVTYTVTTNPAPGLLCSNVTSSISVWVNPLPNPNFTFVNNCINAQPNTFDASSSLIAVGVNTLFAWSYGDAGAGTGAISSHTYATSGVYNVTLTVTSDKGCIAKTVKPVEVYEKPMVNILNSGACLTKAMTFTASTLAGSGIVNTWNWDFNNTIATFETFGQTTSFVFPAAGNQTVNLVAITDHGCTETFTKVVYVDYVPMPLFTVNTPSGCATHCVTFTDNTLPITGPGVNANWTWVFGDGTSLNAGTNTTQTHCYGNSTSDQIKQYDVKLVVTTNKGCRDSLTNLAMITVFPKPIAAYTVNPNPGNIVTPLEYFTNQSIDYTKFWWLFGDSPIMDSINTNPTHTYNNETAETYPVTLMVANQYGCKDTAIVKVELLPAFTFYIPNAFTPDNEDNLNDVFTGMGIGIAKYEMWIFDRWGAKIFYTDDIRKGWNGKVTGKTNEVQQDVYVYKVKLVDVLGKKHDYVGHVTVVKGQ